MYIIFNLSLKNMIIPTIKFTFTGRHMIISRRSVEARLTRKMFVGDLKDFFRMTVRMMRMFPETPKQNMKLNKNLLVKYFPH